MSCASSSEACTYLDIEVVLLRLCLLLRQQLECVADGEIEHLADVLTKIVSTDVKVRRGGLML